MLRWPRHRRACRLEPHPRQYHLDHHPRHPEPAPMHRPLVDRIGWPLDSDRQPRRQPAPASSSAIS